MATRLTVPSMRHRSWLEHFESSHANNDGQADIQWQKQTWRVLRQTLHSEADPNQPAPASPGEHDENTKRYSSLVLLVGVPLDPALRPLQSLLLGLAAASVTIWLFFAAVGRWLCEKALAPMARMARTARSISAADLSQRLPPPGTNDELEDLARAFNDLLTRFQISFERQQRFAGEASHQLRTPLTAMLGQLEVALRRDRNSDEYRRALESVSQQAVRLRQIVEMLLFLTRENSDAPACNSNIWNCAAGSPSICILGNRTRATATSGSKPIATHELWVGAHSGLLAQAVDNLLDNACKYSQPGSPIVVRLGRQDEKIALAVEDRGCGIAAKELPHVFDPFFRSAEATRRGIAGTGLGLPVARRIVAAMNGDLEVHSTAGKGSQFIILLAAAQRVQVPPQPAAAGASKRRDGIQPKSAFQLHERRGWDSNPWWV